MPMHNWTLVAAGIFHAFHHGWISTISNALNSGLLPPEYYALPEQQAAGFGPDVLTLQEPSRRRSEEIVEIGRLHHIAHQAANPIHGRDRRRVLPSERRVRWSSGT